MIKKDFSLIVPCYNEGPTFETSVSKIIRELNSIKKKWEIVFVEDKSTDATKESISKIINVNKNCKAIFHKKNLGRGAAVMDGILVSRAPICGFIDVDCEISEKYISIFLKEITAKNCDMVVAKRFYENSLASIIRFIASKVYSFIAHMVLPLPIYDTEAGYKFFKSAKIKPILKTVKDKRWFWDTEVCARAYWAGLKISEVPVLFIRRKDKKSTVRVIPDSIEYLKKLVAFRMGARQIHSNAK